MARLLLINLRRDATVDGRAGQSQCTALNQRTFQVLFIVELSGQLENRDSGSSFGYTPGAPDGKIQRIATIPGTARTFAIRLPR